MTTYRPILERAALVLAALLVAGPALAGGGSWSSSQNAFGTIVSNGEQSFFAPDEKAGRQMAKALNKAEKKAERAEGNGGSQPAPDHGGNQGGEQGNGGDNESRD
jgi:hypothetical protein